MTGGTANQQDKSSDKLRSEIILNTDFPYPEVPSRVPFPKLKRTKRGCLNAALTLFSFQELTFASLYSCTPKISPGGKVILKQATAEVKKGH